jgi:hypothetical protein
MMGRGAGLRVDCGSEPIRTCIEAAMPMIEKGMTMMMLHGRDMGGERDRPRRERDWNRGDDRGRDHRNDN